MALAHGTNYMANHQVAPQIIQGTPNYNVEVSEGQTPPGEWYPASWLPVVQSENRIAGSGYVLMPGKVISLDGDKRLVPSGLSDELKAAGVALASPAAAEYTALDEQNGVVTKLNTFAQAGASISTANGFDDAQANGNFLFTAPIGIMRYASLMSPGLDPSNPATFTKHAYDTGGSRAFTRYCYIQVPVVEVGTRTETIKAGQSNYRIALYPQATPVVAGCTFKALGSMMGKPAVAGTADQFTMLGRTLLFNDVLAADKTITYTPVIKTPFSALTVNASDVATGGINGAIAQLLGQSITYDANSNFIVQTGSTVPTVGRLLDVKFGVNDDLKLVRSYYRDFGLWQEQPGSATDGRNTQLSIVNAPTYMARIAINFPGNGL
jgi:hypothetical protein